MDRISRLPPGIIETILCLVPIQEAARTSILSKEWRYHWTKIPKLAFIEDAFQVSDDEAELSVLEQTFDQPSHRRVMTSRCKLFYAIYQVLLMHEGPIHDFALKMVVDGSCVEIDHIIFHLSKKNTVKILKLHCIGIYKLPLSIFSLHQLTDLYLTDCVLDNLPSSIVFGSLTTLYLQDIETCPETLLCLLSSCPSLKRLSLMSDSGTIYESGDSTIADLVECLPVVEYLRVLFFIISCFLPLPKTLPTTLVHLKYLCVDDVNFSHIDAVPFLVLLIRSSPNLEKLKLEMYVESLDESVTGSFILEDDSDITLEHLKDLEIINFSNEANELVFVKLILAKSPVLKNVRILLWDELDEDEKLQIPEIILSLPCASPVVKITVSRTPLVALLTV